MKRHKPYPEIEDKFKGIQPCYCCEQDAVETKAMIGTHLHAFLCPLCLGAAFKEVDGYLQLDCPFHGQTSIKDMVNYWRAVDIYNEKFGTSLRGKVVKLGINWEKETENLRKKWKEMLEK